jgi:hypothetical protein
MRLAATSDHLTLDPNLFDAQMKPVEATESSEALHLP